MTLFRILIPLLLAALLTGCPKAYIATDGTAYQDPSLVPPPPPREEPRPLQTARDEERRPGEIDLEETDLGEAPAAEPPRIGSRTSVARAGVTGPQTTPVIDRLTEQVRDQMVAGDLDGAFTTAERALRIDGSDPELWHLLARIQLERDNPAQAEQLAKRSNLLAKGDRDLQAENWRLIYRSRQERGDLEGARTAEERALELEAFHPMEDLREESLESLPDMD